MWVSVGFYIPRLTYKCQNILVLICVKGDAVGIVFELDWYESNSECDADAGGQARQQLAAARLDEEVRRLCVHHVQVYWSLFIEQIINQNHKPNMITFSLHWLIL